MVMHRRSRPDVDRDPTIRRSRWRFSVGAKTIAVAIATVFTICFISLLSSEGWIRRPIELAPEPPSANTDRDLFDIVYSDLIGDTESDHAGGTGPERSQILILVDARTFTVSTSLLEDVLGDQIENVPAEIRADLVRRNFRHGYTLADYHPLNPHIIVQDIWIPYLRRSVEGKRPETTSDTETGSDPPEASAREWTNAGPNALPRFRGRIANQLVEIKPIPVPGLDTPSAVQYRGYLLPRLPGYSHDGRMALVCFRCDRSFNADFGYYLLRKVKGRWEIVLKGFSSVPSLPPSAY
jgi:hypothetical protein